MTDLHTCSYHCHRPECIKAQRDYLRDLLAKQQTAIMDRGCFERGCACYDDRVDRDGVEVQLMEKTK